MSLQEEQMVGVKAQTWAIVGHIGESSPFSRSRVSKVIEKGASHLNPLQRAAETREGFQAVLTRLELLPGRLLCAR